MKLKINVVKKPYRLVIDRYGELETITVEAESEAAAKLMVPEDAEFVTFAEEQTKTNG